MTRSLAIKLLFSFVVVGLAGTAVLALLAATATAGEFNDFMFALRRDGIAEQLSDYYVQNQTWEGVPGTLLGTGYRNPRGFHGAGPRFVPYLLVDQDGSVIVPSPGYHIGEIVPAGRLTEAVSVTVDGQPVGQLIMDPGVFGRDPAEGAFLDRIYLSLGVGALGGTAAAVVLGLLLSRSVLKPLGELTEGARAVAAGDLDIQVPVRSSDELGVLATAFNQMNGNLARARDLRRQMTADIAHELRTPLSIILGHSEGMKEGVLDSTEENLEIIHQEAMRLERLVEDLRTLSLVEAGELPLEITKIDPAVLLRRAAASYRAAAKKKAIELVVMAEDSLPAIEADSDRLIQVLGNLISNALRHAPEGGKVTLSATPIDGWLQIGVSDNGPGIPPEDLPHVFDRFYRADKSRRRDGPGSGLGLAIAKSLVEAHAGTIRAESPPPKAAGPSAARPRRTFGTFGEGTQLIIELPLLA